MTPCNLRTISKLITMLCVGVIAYLILPALKWDLYFLPQPPNPLANALILLASLIFLGFIILELVIESYQKKFKHLEWWLIELPPKAILGLLIVTMLANHIAWKNETMKVSNLELRINNATPEQLIAGRSYLKTNQISDPVQFLQLVEPLLLEYDWVFPLDNPEDYLIAGKYGLAESDEPKWKYTLPLDPSRSNIAEIIKQADVHMQQGNEPAATDIAAIALGVGNRLAEQPQFTATTLGMDVLLKTTRFLQIYPQLSRSAQVRVELKRAGNIIKVLKNAQLEACAALNRQIEEPVRENGELTVSSFAFPPNPINECFDRWVASDAQTTKNGPKFIRAEQLKLIVQFQPIQALLIGIGLPFTKDSEINGEELITRVKKLQTM